MSTGRDVGREDVLKNPAGTIVFVRPEMQSVM